MPPPLTKLTQSEKDLIVRFLTEKGAANAPCHVCQNKEWVIGESLVLHSVYMPGGFMIAAGFPSVLLVCMRCTNFRFHSAAAMGLIPEEKPPSSFETKDAEVKHG